MFEVDTDELLTKLAALAEWPHPDDVTWDPRVSELATDSARDAQAMSERLSGIEVGGPLPSGGIADTLGNDWIAPLTEFQQRDISKLLSL
ncbi:MAG: DNA helicase, partial [Candidatus Nanopelagicales bacterium]